MHQACDHHNEGNTVGIEGQLAKLTATTLAFEDKHVKCVIAAMNAKQLEPKVNS